MGNQKENKQNFVQGLFTGERALYNIHGAKITDSSFEDGESPLKECSDLTIKNCFFKWKYPLWYCDNVTCYNTTFLEMARSGIWYTKNISFKDSFIDAPKTFRRSSDIALENVSMPKADETFWSCKNITLKNVNATGNYFCMNSENIFIDGFKLSGNYAFDGAKNITIRNAIMTSKDSFWNCDNVTVYDSTIIGEYLAWNSKNVKFVNCTIDSEQGMCYMDGVVFENCKLLNTFLCFENSKKIDATITSTIECVKNPISGKITAPQIDCLVMDKELIDPSKTKIKAKIIKQVEKKDLR